MRYLFKKCTYIFQTSSPSTKKFYEKAPQSDDSKLDLEGLFDDFQRPVFKEEKREKSPIRTDEPKIEIEEVVEIRPSSVVRYDMKIRVAMENCKSLPLVENDKKSF